jgi:predicted nucleic acid-binding protein
MARLIDSSLWVDFTRRKSPADLKAMILPWILDPSAALCEPVVFEVLRHATAAERDPIEQQFATLPLLPVPRDLWQNAAKLGQACRDQGFTAGSIDLLIASIALHHGAELVTFDAGFLEIARAAPLRVRLLSRMGL